MLTMSDCWSQNPWTVSKAKYVSQLSIVRLYVALLGLALLAIVGTYTPELIHACVRRAHDAGNWNRQISNSN